MSLCSSNHAAKVIVSSNSNIARAIPVCRNCTIPRTVLHLSLTNESLASCLVGVLARQNCSFAASTRQRVIHSVGRGLYCITRSCGRRCRSSLGSSTIRGSCRLPSKRIVAVKDRHFHTPRTLFRPSFLKLRTRKVRRAACGSVGVYSISVQGSLCDGVILSKKAAVCSNLPREVRGRVATLTPSAVGMGIVTPPREGCSM